MTEPVEPTQEEIVEQPTPQVLPDETPAVEEVESEEPERHEPGGPYDSEAVDATVEDADFSAEEKDTEDDTV